MTLESSDTSSNDRRHEDYDNVYYLTSKLGQSAIDSLDKEQTNNPEIDLHQEEPKKPNKAIIVDRYKSKQKESTMPNGNDFATILEKLDKISSQNQEAIHYLESRIDSRLKDFKDEFHEFRRDVREDVQKMQNTVDHMDESYRQINQSIKESELSLIHI